MSFQEATTTPHYKPARGRRAEIALIKVTVAATLDSIFVEDESVCSMKEMLHISIDEIDRHYKKEEPHPVLEKMDQALQQKCTDAGSDICFKTAIVQVDKFNYMGVVHNLLRSCTINGFDVKFAVLARES